MIENDGKERQDLKQHLDKEFEIKEVGRLEYFLGIEVAHSKKGIFISQQKYVPDLLRETDHKLGDAEEDVVTDREMYQRLVGKLIYFSHTRPDIAYNVTIQGRFIYKI